MVNNYLQKLAIKKMNLQATKEFLAELQVLTNVHHTNLVSNSPSDYHHSLQLDIVILMDQVSYSVQYLEVCFKTPY